MGVVMVESDLTTPQLILERIQNQARNASFRLTQHAQQEMVEEEITLDEVTQALLHGSIIEDYPQHRRGPCCLVSGFSDDRRPLHIVCTSAQPLLIIITVYEPKLPKWLNSLQRKN